MRDKRLLPSVSVGPKSCILYGKVKEAGESRGESIFCHPFPRLARPHMLQEGDEQGHPRTTLLREQL